MPEFEKSCKNCLHQIIKGTHPGMFCAIDEFSSCNYITNYKLCQAKERQVEPDHNYNFEKTGQQTISSIQWKE